MRIILASSSPRRRELLKLLGLEFEVIPSKVKEEIDESRKDFDNIVMEIAFKKAKEVYERTFEERIVIGADTVVVKDGKVLGKPPNDEKAKEFLKILSGSIHEVFTGVCIMTSDETIKFYEKTTVWFRKLPDYLINAYVERFNPFDKAGAYGIQDLGAVFVEKIEGDFYTVMGLPIGKIWDVFYKKGWWK